MAIYQVTDNEIKTISRTTFSFQLLTQTKNTVNIESITSLSLCITAKSITLLVIGAKRMQRYLQKKLPIFSRTSDLK